MSTSLGKITQVAFMTRDISGSIDHFAEHLGIGPWFMIEGGTFAECRYRGAICAPRLTTAFANARGMEFELMQLDNDVECMWKDALAKPFVRESFHHWCHWPDDYDRALEEALGQGYGVYQDGSTSRGRFAYLEHPDQLDDIVELTERTPARRAFQQLVADEGQAWDGVRRVITDWA